MSDEQYKQEILGLVKEINTIRQGHSKEHSIQYVTKSILTSIRTHVKNANHSVHKQIKDTYPKLSSKDKKIIAKNISGMLGINVQYEPPTAGGVAQEQMPHDGYFNIYLGD